MTDDTRHLIFISHSSHDKDYVEKVLRYIPRSHVFYDVATIDPAEKNIDALDEGLLDASVFALFVSPNTQNCDWTTYEASIAQFQKIRRQNLEVLIIPIKGATYKDAPTWMQAYMAASEKYAVADVARLIKYAFEKSLRNQGLLRAELFVGRENLSNNILTEIRTRPTKTGIPINFVILAGIQNMGRTSVGRHISPRIFPGSRTDIPIFDLPRHADAFELFLTLRNEAEDGLTEDRLRELSSSWPAEDPAKMAETIAANLSHYADLNQTVMIRSARGLRDVGRSLKEWLPPLFRLLAANPNVRIIWISERLLDPVALEPHQNVAQFSIPELDHDSIFIILSELLEPRASSTASLHQISKRLNGHPGTAHYVARLIELGQRSPESITQSPHYITAYQQRFLEELLDAKSLSDVEMAILQIVSLVPSIEIETLCESLDEYETQTIGEALGDLVDDCLITYSLNLGYKVPEIVRSVFLIKSKSLPRNRIQKLADRLAARLRSEKISLATIEGIIFANVLLEGKIPDAFRSIITGSMLHDLVYQNYQLGRRIKGEWKKHLEIAASLAELAEIIHISRDSCETVLFYGAEAIIRMGGDPANFIVKMQKRGFASADVIKGSTLYYRKRDRKGAIECLSRALRNRAFTNRTARLLAKILTEDNQASRALEVLEELGQRRVHSDSGLLSQKIKCLRAAGRSAEASNLMETLKGLDDEYGEYEMITAAQFFRDGRHKDALNAIERARARPLVNHVNLALLEASIKVESGNTEELEEACKLATATGRYDDAHNLRARAALQLNDWEEAETELRAIQKPNYFDRQLMLRVLDRKVNSPKIVADPGSQALVKREHEKLLVELRGIVVEFDRLDAPD